jgi:hypothetical protein
MVATLGVIVIGIARVFEDTGELGIDPKSEATRVTLAVHLSITQPSDKNIFYRGSTAIEFRCNANVLCLKMPIRRERANHTKVTRFGIIGCAGKSRDIA